MLKVIGVGCKGGNIMLCSRDILIPSESRIYSSLFTEAFADIFAVANLKDFYDGIFFKFPSSTPNSMHQ